MKWHGIDMGITMARQEADIAAGNNKTSGDGDSNRTGTDRDGDNEWHRETWRQLEILGGHWVRMDVK